jgi:TolB-like protein/tetratricopeptide (TPR) repeat protein
MPEGVEGSRKLENAHLLLIGLLGYSDLPPSRRREEMDALDRLVRSGTRFRVTEVAGKVVCSPTGDGMALAFFGDAEGAMECATEIATALKDHSKTKSRMGMHDGQVIRDIDVRGEPTLSGEGVDVARAVMGCGDADHILLSKRIAYELAPLPRWNAHLYELDDWEPEKGRKIGLVNFYTDAIGNREVPAQLKRQQERAARAARLRRLRRPLVIAAASALLLAAVVAGFLSLHRRLTNIAAPPQPVRPPAKSVAVLPLVDLSRARDQEYFCHGVSDEIRGILSKTKNLQVIARSSSLAFKGPSADLNEAARKLDVQNVLEGSLHRDGGWVRLSVHLVHARSGIEIWSKTYDGQVSELPSVEDHVARSVARVLKVDAPAARHRWRRREDLASDLYLQGLFLSHKNSEEELRAGLDFFRLVLDKDPQLEAAFTGTARIWLTLADEFIPPLNAYPQAQWAAEKALALNGEDAEAHALLGESKRIFDWDLKGEETELGRALQIDPNSVLAHVLMAKLKTDLGEREESLAQLRKAVRLDPLSPMIGHVQVSIDVANDRLDKALAATKRTMEVDPDYTYFEPDLALVYREQGKLRQALDIYLRLKETRRKAAPGLAITYARLGMKEEAKKVLSELVQAANTRYVPAEQIASVFVALGDKEEAFRWLDRGVDEHSATIHEIGRAPEFRALHSDPRFGDVLRRIGLAPPTVPPHS